jgi:ElaB/YqjD/DUF883 family membrane-anchored ribosome-binding protein
MGKYRASGRGGVGILASPAPGEAARLQGSQEKEYAMTSFERTRDQLVDDFSAVLSEAEDLLKKASNETGDRARDLRSQVEAKLLGAKLRLQELEGEAVDRAKAAARMTDDYVHENPWQVVGVAVAVGFLVGLMMNRR